jgi:uncharacterized protein (TIRG00374 family)
MVTEESLSLKRAIPFLLAGILIFIVYLYFFVGITEIVNILKRVNLLYYSSAVVFLFLTVLVNALTWQYFLRPLSVKATLRKTFLFTWIAIFVDILVPAEAISGDASKVYLMAKESGENAGKVVASVVSHRILAMVMSLGSLAFSAVALYIFEYELPALIFNLILLVIVGTAIAIFFILLCSIKETLTKRIVDAVLRFLAFVSRGRLNLGSMRNKASKALCSFHGSIGFLRKNPRSLLPPVFFAIVSWLFSVFLSYLVFLSLGQQVSFVLIMIVYSISLNVQSIPLGIPAEVGVVEIMMTSLYGLLGVEAGIAAAATVLIRLLTVWLRLVVGLVAIQWIDLKDLAKNLRQDLF